MPSDYQPSLLSDADQRAADVSWAYNRSSASAIPRSELVTWKQRVAQYQHQVRLTPQAQQGALFDMAPAPASVETIDPFTLPPQNAAFWRGQFDEAGGPALYFVIDDAAVVLLYVGETIKANQRWKGVHDCKRYILSYIEAHRSHQLSVAVNISFWPHAAADRQARQRLELDLIRHWRSPFNKENWTLWNTPFVQAE